MVQHTAQVLPAVAPSSLLLSINHLTALGCLHAGVILRPLRGSWKQLDITLGSRIAVIDSSTWSRGDQKTLLNIARDWPAPTADKAPCHPWTDRLQTNTTIAGRMELLYEHRHAPDWCLHLLAVDDRAVWESAMPLAVMNNPGDATHLLEAWLRSTLIPPPASWLTTLNDHPLSLSACVARVEKILQAPIPHLPTAREQHQAYATRAVAWLKEVSVCGGTNTAHPAWARIANRGTGKQRQIARHALLSSR